MEKIQATLIHQLMNEIGRNSLKCDFVKKVVEFLIEKREVAVWVDVALNFWKVVICRALIRFQKLQAEVLPSGYRIAETFLIASLF